VTISIGIACMVPRKDISKELLIVHADKALYESKAKGRNRTTLYKDI